MIDTEGKFVTTKSGRAYSPPQVVDIADAPGMIRTCGSLIRSEISSTASGYGSYDLLTFFTGCSRQRVPSVTTHSDQILCGVSQVCLNHRTRHVYQRDECQR